MYLIRKIKLSKFKTIDIKLESSKLGSCESKICIPIHYYVLFLSNLDSVAYNVEILSP